MRRQCHRCCPRGSTGQPGDHELCWPGRFGERRQQPRQDHGQTGRDGASRTQRRGHGSHRRPIGSVVGASVSLLTSADDDGDLAKDDRDADSDGIRDGADTDDDGDFIADAADSFPLDPSETSDVDADGIGDSGDTDAGADGVVTIIDAFPEDPTETTDSDNDGTTIVQRRHRQQRGH